MEPGIERFPMQPGDVERTCADISRARDVDPDRLHPYLTRPR